MRFDDAIEQIRLGWRKKAAERDEALDEELERLLNTAHGAEGYRAVEKNLRNSSSTDSRPVLLQETTRRLSIVLEPTLFWEMRRASFGIWRTL